MSQRPMGGGACCPPAVSGVTYLRIGPKKTLVGIQGLDTVFQQLLAMGRKPDEVSDGELVDMARKSNYIRQDPQVEADYAAALRAEYTRVYTCQEAQREGTG